MASEFVGLRAQILANARVMMKTTSHANTPSVGSQSTLLPASTSYYGDLDIVVFGTKEEFTACVMVGLTPAIEGPAAVSPEGALRKLFLSTCDLLKQYIPKVGSHQRNIHVGGGVYDEDMISAEIVDAQKKSP